MAKNTGNGYRIGPVNDRSQRYNPKTELWTKVDSSSGRFMDTKLDGEPFKGVRREQPRDSEK